MGEQDDGWAAPSRLRDWRPWNRGHRVLSLLVVGVVVGVWFLAAYVREPDTGVAALHVGDCVAVPHAGMFVESDVRTIDCDESHVAEVYAIGDAAQAPTSRVDVSDDPEVDRICRRDVEPQLAEAIGRRSDVVLQILRSTNRPTRLLCLAVTREPRTSSFVDEAG